MTEKKNSKYLKKRNIFVWLYSKNVIGAVFETHLKANTGYQWVDPYFLGTYNTNPCCTTKLTVLKSGAVIYCYPEELTDTLPFEESSLKIEFCIFWWCSRKSDLKISKLSVPEVNRKFSILLAKILVDCHLVSIEHVRYLLTCLGLEILKSWRWNAKRNDRGYTTAEAWLLINRPWILKFIQTSIYNIKKSVNPFSIRKYFHSSLVLQTTFRMPRMPNWLSIINLALLSKFPMPNHFGIVFSNAQCQIEILIWHCFTNAK